MLSVESSILFTIIDHLEATKLNRSIGIIIGVPQKSPSLFSNIKHSVEGNYKSIVTDCFPIPFKEEEDSSVCYVDTSYAKKMFMLKKKVNKDVRVLGWYSSADSIRANDLFIHSLLKVMEEKGVFMLVDAKSQLHDAPVKAFVQKDNKFMPIPVKVEMTNPEEIGIEHLLRTVGKGTQEESIEKNIEGGKKAMEAMLTKIKVIQRYLKDILNNKISPDYKILTKVQSITDNLDILKNEDERLNEINLIYKTIKSVELLSSLAVKYVK